MPHRTGLRRGHRHAQFGVILLPETGLGLGAADSGRPAIAAASASASTLVISMSCAPIGRDVVVIWAVNSHRASPLLLGAGCGTKTGTS